MWLSSPKVKRTYLNQSRILNLHPSDYIVLLKTKYSKISNPPSSLRLYSFTFNKMLQDVSRGVSIKFSHSSSNIDISNTVIDSALNCAN